jgi:ActR/RegA family two-component response regulator
VSTRVVPTDSAKPSRPSTGAFLEKPMPAAVVVDPDGVARAEVAFVLSAAGYRVTNAGDFREAANAITAAPPDLLVTELRLGAYNGLHLIHRGLRSRGDMRSIVLTGFPDPVLESEARSIGASYIVKPADPSILLVAASGESTALRERRHSPRRGMPQRISVTVADHQADLLDVSDRGFSIDLYDQEVHPTFELSLPNSSVRVKATTVWTRRPSATSGLQRCGAALDNLDDPLVMAWREFVGGLDRQASADPVPASRLA